MKRYYNYDNKQNIVDHFSQVMTKIFIILNMLQVCSHIKKNSIILLYRYLNYIIFGGRGQMTDLSLL